jgi:hypothetical protein
VCRRKSCGDWWRLDARIEIRSREIETIARQDAGCDRLMSVPGIGPIISSAVVADRLRRRVLEGMRLRCLAGAGAHADLECFGLKKARFGTTARVKSRLEPGV